MRPEKIHLEAPGAAVPAGCVSLDGHIHDVVYLGSDTRYLVTLDAGGELEVIKQNVTTSSMEVLALKGRAVRLVWDRIHTLPGGRRRDAAGRGDIPPTEVRSRKGLEEEEP